jgi:hypothetical protein
MEPEHAGYHKEVVAKIMELVEIANDVFSDEHSIFDDQANLDTEISSEIAMTNAFGWYCDQVAVEEIHVSFDLNATKTRNTPCWKFLVRVCAHYSGDQHPDKMMHGDSITAEIDLKFNNYNDDLDAVVVKATNDLQAECDREDAALDQAVEDAAEDPDYSGNAEDW